MECVSGAWWGANVRKLCRRWSGEAVDELGGRREKGGPVSPVPLVQSHMVRGVTDHRGRVLTQGSGQSPQRSPR